QENVGSPCYMSPEQMWTPRSVDTRTDIWSLGVVLYQLLTGALPFDGESVSEVFSRVASAEFAPVSALRPDVDPYLDAIVRRCLEKSLDLRYPSVGALAEDIDLYEKKVLSATDPSLRFATPGVRIRSDAPVSAPVNEAALPFDRMPLGLVMLPALALVTIALFAIRGPGIVGTTLSDGWRRAAEFAEGHVVPARLGGEPAELDAPLTTASVRVVEPSGVIVRDPKGASELPAEREEASRPSSSGRGLTDEDRRGTSYDRYLHRHGWRPLKDVLEEMNRN
ncbi:MAG TPA: protein kinase, partial [Polyangiaceae bacterium]